MRTSIKSIHPFPARMAPELVWDELPDSLPRLRVLDPMAGSGTTLVTAKLRGHEAIGFDRDPLAISNILTQHTGIEELISQEIRPMQKIKAIAELLGDQRLPSYLISYIESFCPGGDESIAVHMPKSIAGYTDKAGETDTATITRTKGFIGDPQMELTKYPNAIHHINIFFNASGRARVFYKYHGSIRFLKTARKT
jgi:hypothetical protein